MLIMKALAQGLVKGKIDEVLLPYSSLVFELDSKTLLRSSEAPNINLY